MAIARVLRDVLSARQRLARAAAINIKYKQGN